MKISLGVYTEDGRYFWKMLNEVFGMNLDKLLKLFTEGVAKSLKPLEVELESLLSKEDIKGQLAFRCRLKLESDKVEFYIECYLQPKNFDYWFVFLKLPPLYYPKDAILETKKLLNQDINTNLVKGTFSSQLDKMIYSFLETDLPSTLLSILEFKKWLSAYDPSLSAGEFVTI